MQKNIVILLIIIFISVNCLNLHLYFKGNKKIEKMSNTSTIKKVINDIYIADVQAIRNLAEVSQKLQINGLTIPGNLDVKGKFNYLPKGLISIWYGTSAPKGWALCNGKNGTPDLRGRFVYGYGSRLGSKFKRYGGAERHTLSYNEMPKHRHSGTTASKSHRHSYSARHRRFKVARSCAAICKYSTIGDYGKRLTLM